MIDSVQGVVSTVLKGPDVLSSCYAVLPLRGLDIIVDSSEVNLFGRTNRSGRPLSVIKGAYYLQGILSLVKYSIITAALNHTRELTIKVPLVGV